MKDWRAGTILGADRLHFNIHTDRWPVSVESPIERARHYAHAAVDVLQNDPQLTFTSGLETGKPSFPWSYGVALPNLSCKQFAEGRLDEVIPQQRVICPDEMLEAVEPEVLQQRLWGMFPGALKGASALPQIDGVRWHFFPEVWIPQPQGELFATEPAPDLVRVMDLQLEQPARSLGEGHRVIHRSYHRDTKLIRGLLPAYGIPLVVIPGADKIKGADEQPDQEARLLLADMTRATRELVLCGVGAIEF